MTPEHISRSLHQFPIIGEAAKPLPDALRSAHPEIQWKQMAGMRDILVHRYDDVILEEVWKAVVDDLPGLIEAVERLLPPRE